MMLSVRNPRGPACRHSRLGSRMCTRQVCIQPFIQRERCPSHALNRIGASSSVVESNVTDRQPAIFVVVDAEAGLRTGDIGVVAAKGIERRAKLAGIRAVFGIEHGGKTASRK